MSVLKMMGVHRYHYTVLIFSVRKDYIDAFQWKSRRELACLIKLSFYNHPIEEHVLEFYAPLTTS